MDVWNLGRIFIFILSTVNVIVGTPAVNQSSLMRQCFDELGLGNQQIDALTSEELDEIVETMKSKRLLPSPGIEQVPNNSIKLVGHCLEKIGRPQDHPLSNLTEYEFARLKAVIDTEHDYVSRYVKHFACGWRLLASIDALDFNFPYEKALDIVNKYQYMGTNLFRKRRKKFSYIVKKFANVVTHSRENERTWIVGFQKALEFLQKMLLVESANVTDGSPLDVKVALTQLKNAKSLEEAKELYWNKQKPFWKKLLQSDPEVNLILDKLSRKLPMSEMDKFVKKVHFTDRVYMYDTLNNGRLFTQAVPDRYKKCVWFMSHSGGWSEKQQQIETDLRKLWHWPGYSDFSRSDLFCHYLSELYRIITGDNCQILELWTGVPSHCEPDKQDYIDYLKYFKNRNLFNVGLILKNLYNESSNSCPRLTLSEAIQEEYLDTRARMLDSK